MTQRFGAMALAVALALAGCMGSRGTSPPASNPTDKIPTGGNLEPDFSDVPDAVDAPGGSQAATTESRVTKVTVYSDRARVTRQGTVEVTTEPTVFAFRKLPGWVDDGSVRVSSTAGRLVDVRVERSFLAQASDKNWQKAEAEHRDLTGQLAALGDEIAVLDAQKNQIEAIKVFSLEKLSKDTIIGDISVASYGDVLEFISDALRKTAAARRAVEVQRDAITPRFEASLRRLEEMKSLMTLEETTVLVTLQSSRTAPSTIEVTYMLPGATWEPLHELRVSTSDAKEVEVISFAAVTQTSGEDWGNAELSFSTQSSTESVRIPELEALTLGDTGTATRLITSKLASFTRAQKAFEGQSQLWNKVHQTSYGSSERMNFEQVYQTNMEYLQVAQSKTVQIFETLQNRGTTAHFKAATAHSVRGDGHPIRMRIGKSTLKSVQKIVAVPEQSLNAARTLEMVNSTDQAFLPGKVALYQDGAFIGMTDMDFIAQGESFSLFVSVADQLKLSRQLDRKQSSLIQKKRNKMRVAFIVTAENLSGQETSFTLADRIPVSENKDIRIENVKISPGGNPDSQGILRWDLVLKPKEIREFRISYEVEYPAELILDARRKREAMPAMPNAAPTARAMEDYQIEDQLMDLESML